MIGSGGGGVVSIEVKIEGGELGFSLPSQILDRFNKKLKLRKIAFYLEMYGHLRIHRTFFYFEQTLRHNSVDRATSLARLRVYHQIKIKKILWFSVTFILPIIT